MSPQLTRRPFQSLGFPRVSGDEPWLTLLFNFTVMFSPRERG